MLLTIMTFSADLSFSVYKVKVFIKCLRHFSSTECVLKEWHIVSDGAFTESGTISSIEKPV